MTSTQALDAIAGLSPEQLDALVKLAQKETEPKPAKTPRKRRQHVKYFTEAEIAALFKVIESPRDRAMFRVAYHRGLRASEIGLIQLSDWDPHSERLNVTRLKGSRGGPYRVTANELRTIRAWLKVRGTDPGPMFQSRQGKGITQQRLDQIIKAYGAKAGLPAEKCHMHAFKHACGTHLLNLGLDLCEVQDHLGHVNPSSTSVYASFGDKRREQRDKRLRDW